MNKEELKQRIVLKWGNIRFCDNFDVNSETYKAFSELVEREDKIRELNGGGRRENRDKECMQLCLRAIMKAPKGTIFKNDFTDKFLTKQQALDYVINYEFDY